MYNAILIFMLITLLSNLFRKKKVSTSLNCGIFAWVGTEPKNFSPVLFNILGVYNDNRGGDSCGVYFNRGVIHGIGAEARYEAMVKTQKLHTTVKPGKWPVVVGHCRKASVGTVNSENSQPILVRNEKENRLLYVQAHNGTISNHKELAAKYKESFTHTESDSVIIARLIQKHGFDILKEYEGSAALVMHFTKEPNSLYAFHGESYKYNVKQEERPLHYVNIPGSGTYISSEAPPLEFIANGTKATSFKFNVLYKLTGNEVEEVMTIEREVKKPVVTTTSHGSGWNRNTNAYGYNDEYAENVLPFRDKGASSSSSYSTKGVVPNIVLAGVVDHVHNADERILWSEGAYRIGKRLCHGKYTVDTWGYIQGPYAKISTKKFVLYFFYGILVSALDDFYELDKYAKSKGHTTAVDIFQSNNWAAYSEMLGNTAVFPFTKIVVSASTGYMEASLHCPNAKGDASSYFTGEFQPLFGMYTYDFENGNYVGYTRETSVMTLTKFLNENTYLDEFHFAQDPIVDAYAEDCKNRLDNDDVDNAPIVNLPVKAEEEDSIIADCNDCTVYKDPAYDGGACLVCQVELGKTKKSEVAGLFRDKAQVDSMIKGNLPAIVDDIEQLIGDLDETKKTHLIVKEYAVLTDARKKLKEIKI
jgi:hypothetical protein